MSCRFTHVGLFAALLLGLCFDNPNAKAWEGQFKRSISYQSKNDLFANYYEGPQPSGTVAQMYVSPLPVPPHVGHTYTTYQPLMPHEYLYRHTRTHYAHNPGGLDTLESALPHVRFESAGYQTPYELEPLLKIDFQIRCNEGYLSYVETDSIDVGGTVCRGVVFDGRSASRGTLFAATSSGPDVQLAWQLYLHAVRPAHGIGRTADGPTANQLELGSAQLACFAHRSPIHAQLFRPRPV